MEGQQQYYREQPGYEERQTEPTNCAASARWRDDRAHDGQADPNDDEFHAALPSGAMVKL